MNKVRTSLSFLLFTLLLLSIAGVGFAESPWDQTDVDPKHNWTIKFNTEVDSKTINKENIYVKHGADSVVGIEVRLNDDKKSATVIAPSEGYIQGESYSLYISQGVTSSGTKKLKDAISMQFTVKKDEIEPINHAPIMIKEIPNQTMKVGEMRTLDIGNYFNDPDERDALTFTVTEGIISGNQWTYSANEAKEIDVTITATDIKNQKVSSTFKVVVDSVQNQQGTLYDSIYQALLHVDPEVDVSQFTKDSNQVFDVLEEVLADHPEIYYFSYKGSLFWSNGRFELKYQFPKSQIIEMNNQLEQVTEKIISENISADMSEFEKVKAIHDYVVLHTAYDYENYQNGTIPDSSYGIDGLLLKGIAVCDGYAKSMLYVLDKMGMETLYVTGTANDELHAWNKVKIDGEWYSLDATWDDPTPNKEGYVRYNYFLIPDNKLDDDHSWDDAELPDATATTYVFMADMRDFFLNNDYYYYSSHSDDMTLYKIKIDGTGKQKIADVRANELVVYGDWIYFNNWSYGGYLFKIKTNGKALTKLTDFEVKNIELDQAVVRYMDKDGLKSYSLNVF